MSVKAAKRVFQNIRDMIHFDPQRYSREITTYMWDQLISEHHQKCSDLVSEKFTAGATAAIALHTAGASLVGTVVALRKSEVTRLQIHLIEDECYRRGGSPPVHRRQDALAGVAVGMLAAGIDATGIAGAMVGHVVSPTVAATSVPALVSAGSHFIDAAPHTQHFVHDVIHGTVHGAGATFTGHGLSPGAGTMNPDSVVQQSVSIGVAYAGFEAVKYGAGQGLNYGGQQLMGGVLPSGKIDQPHRPNQSHWQSYPGQAYQSHHSHHRR